jgi:uncharacterized protein (DUF1697 family)
MRYVALLRGINVTGNNMIKMAELREWFEELGFTDVKTYVNSGNIGFDTRKTPDKKLAEKIERAIGSRLQKKISVMIRARGEIAEVLAHNPFEGKYETHKQMHVLFGTDLITKDVEKKILEFQTDTDKVAIRGRDIYALLLGGVAESIVGRGIIEKKLKLPLTGRNWRTVQALAEL